MVGVEAAYGSGCLYIRKRVAGYITAEVCNCMYCGVQCYCAASIQWLSISGPLLFFVRLIPTLPLFDLSSLLEINMPRYFSTKEPTR